MWSTIPTEFLKDKTSKSVQFNPILQYCSRHQSICATTVPSSSPIEYKYKRIRSFPSGSLPGHTDWTLFVLSSFGGRSLFSPCSLDSNTHVRHRKANPFRTMYPGAPIHATPVLQLGRLRDCLFSLSFIVLGVALSSSILEPDPGKKLES